jgi:hypothetical protein
MMDKMESREKLLSLLDYFTAEKLLNEIVVGMSGQEALEMYDHICQMHDLNNEEEDGQNEY